MKRFFLVIFCIIALPVMASHIVGGEFEIIYIQPKGPSDNQYTYRINLILYFDLNNGNPDARDPNILARIYRKSDNFPMRDVLLEFPTESSVNYTQPECSVGGVRTSKIVYSGTIQLPPSQYSDPQGYYIVWERCCRNYNKNNLLNIKSVEPVNNTNHPDAAGQTFYLEFPPVTKNGEQFINSSPTLFPPLSDYACINKPYYTDFAGTDIDGDSLVYSLVTPLNTHNSVALPPGGPGPAPYPLVKWISPYGPNNIMGGNPDLKISKDGLLTVTPGNIVGLFVFAVKCEEFRAGVKLGEVRRDFQMYVLDCPEADPPKITARRLDEPNFSDADRTINYTHSMPDSMLCLEVNVSDPDALKAPGFQEKIKVRVKPIGLKASDGIFDTVMSATLTSTNNGAKFRICFDRCPLIDGPYQVAIIASDDACSLPLLDTIKVTLNLPPPSNSNARFITMPFDTLVEEGEAKLTWKIRAIDDDGHLMTMGAVPSGFKLADAGMTFKVIGQTGNIMEAELSWDPRCDIYNFTKKTEFDIKFIVDDLDTCNRSNPDYLDWKLRIALPENASPVIGSSLTPQQLNEGISAEVFDQVTFQVNGNDVNNDKLTLTGQGIGFSMTARNASFPMAIGAGAVSSTFNWNIQCNNVGGSLPNDFDFRFIVIDTTNKCHVYKADTLDVTVHVLPPSNIRPDLDINYVHPQPSGAPQELAILLGEEISFELTADDASTGPQDLVRIELVEATGNVAPEGYQFSEAEGIGHADTTFTWKPDCSIFKNGVYENIYIFKFRAFDDRCFNVMADTVEVNIRVTDVDGSDTHFLPSNIITPNSDGCNDYFAMEGYELSEGCGEVHVVSLPKDNCVSQFENIRIYNRWGKLVFESADRNFRWFAADEAAGVYYYTVTYTRKTYKGSVSVRY